MTRIKSSRPKAKPKLETLADIALSKETFNMLIAYMNKHNIYSFDEALNKLMTLYEANHPKKNNKKRTK